jgi:uncharacterized protein (DUF1501 family)
MVLGENMDGGKVHGHWPGMEEGQLIGPGDLAVTTDYRDIPAEVCEKRLNHPGVNEIFPNYEPKMRGIFG